MTFCEALRHLKGICLYDWLHSDRILNVYLCRRGPAPDVTNGPQHWHVGHTRPGIPDQQLGITLATC